MAKRLPPGDAATEADRAKLWDRARKLHDRVVNLKREYKRTGEELRTAKADLEELFAPGGKAEGKKKPQLSLVE